MRQPHVTITENKRGVPYFYKTTYKYDPETKRTRQVRERDSILDFVMENYQAAIERGSEIIGRFEDASNGQRIKSWRAHPDWFWRGYALSRSERRTKRLIEFLQGAGIVLKEGTRGHKPSYYKLDMRACEIVDSMRELMRRWQSQLRRDWLACDLSLNCRRDLFWTIQYLALQGPAVPYGVMQYALCLHWTEAEFWKLCERELPGKVKRYDKTNTPYRTTRIMQPVYTCRDIDVIGAWERRHQNE
jgi:hypothetical protein